MQSAVHAFLTDLELFEFNKDLGDLAAVPLRRANKVRDLLPSAGTAKMLHSAFFLLTFASLVVLVI